MGRERCVNFAVLSACCVAQLCWGSIMASAYYVNAFKLKYRYTESQVEFVLPLIHMGKVLCPVAAAVYQMYGLRPTIIVGLLLSSGGYFLLWTSQYFLEFCHLYPAVVYTCFLQLGFGSGFLNLGILKVVTRKFAGNHQGKAISLVMASYGASPFLSLFIYRHCFSDGIIEEDAGQHFHGFMLYSAISNSVIGCLFLVAAALTEHTFPTEKLLIGKDKSECRQSEVQRNWLHYVVDRFKEEMQYIFQWPFQLLVWSFALTYAVFAEIDYNLALYTKSSGIYHVFDSVFVMFHITVFLARFTVGFVSDAFTDTVPSAFYNAIISFIFAVCLCLFSILPTAEVTMYILSIVTGLAGGVIRPVTITILAKNMEEEDFAKNWAITFSFSAVVIAAWAAVFSVLHDADCFGSYCLQRVNMATSAMVLVSTFCSLILAVVKRY